MASSRSSIMLLTLLCAAAFTVTSAIHKEVCEDCEDTTTPGASAMLQVLAKPAKVDPVNFAEASASASRAAPSDSQQASQCMSFESEDAHLEDSRECLPSSLQGAHLNAIRLHAARLAGKSSSKLQKKKEKKDVLSKKDLLEEEESSHQLPDIEGEGGDEECSSAEMQAAWQSGRCNSLNGPENECKSSVAGSTCGSGTATCAMDKCCSSLACTGPAPTTPVDPAPEEDKEEEEQTTPVAPGKEEGPPPIGRGADASLNAGGFKMVTSLCCPPEMEAFFNRLLESKGLSVCSQPHIQGLMHWFSCVPDMDFQYMLDVIANGNPCKYWTTKGSTCPAISDQCAGKYCR